MSAPDPLLRAFQQAAKEARERGVRVAVKGMEVVFSGPKPPSEYLRGLVRQAGPDFRHKIVNGWVPPEYGIIIDGKIKPFGARAQISDDPEAPNPEEPTPVVPARDVPPPIVPRNTPATADPTAAGTPVHDPIPITRGRPAEQYVVQHKETGFTMIKNIAFTLAEYYDLDPSTAWTMMVLARWTYGYQSHLDADGYVTLNAEKLARQINVSRPTLSKALTKLEELGIVKKTRQSRDATGKFTVLHISLEFPETLLPRAEPTPETDQGHTEG